MRHSNGTWVMTGTMPAGAWGSDALSVACQYPNSYPPNYREVPAFTYPQTLQLNVSTPYHLDFSPAGEERAGSPFTVRPVGALCATGNIQLEVTAAPTRNSVSGLVPSSDIKVTPAPLETSAWTATIDLPPSFAGGTYYVDAGCENVERTFFMVYAPGEFAVS